MNNSYSKLSRMAVAGVIAALSQSAYSQLVANGNLYDNAAPNYTFQNFNNGNSSEGNQVVLAGSASSDFLTSFSFQYDFQATAGAAAPTGNETMDVEFLRNDGAQVNGYNSPSTVLFNSGPINFGSVGYTTGSTLSFLQADLGGGVTVPQDFTWLVTFSGLATDENAGLAIYSPIQLGSDGLPNSDAWVNLGTGLEPANDSGNPLTFGAVFNGTAEGVPDSSCLPITVFSVLAGFRWIKRLERRAK